MKHLENRWELPDVYDDIEKLLIWCAYVEGTDRGRKPQQSEGRSGK
jgi:hypothetical protein